MLYFEILSMTKPRMKPTANTGTANTNPKITEVSKSAMNDAPSIPTDIEKRNISMKTPILMVLVFANLSSPVYLSVL